MRVQKQVLVSGVTLLLSLALAACGHGGGGGGAPPNQAPVAQAGADRSVNEGAAVSLDGSASSDPDGTVAAYLWTQLSGPAVTLANDHAAVAGFNAPATTQVLTLVFRLEVTDNDGATDTDDVSVTVNPVNDPPVASDGSFSGAEDSVLSGALSATDPDSATLTFSVVAPPAHGALALQPDGHFSYTPAADFNGADSFTFKANDGAADSNVATASLTVTAVNDPPVANDGGAATNEDQAVSGMVTASDVDSTQLTFAVVSGPAHGALALAANGQFTYTPAANYNGADSFSFAASDGEAASNAATVTISIAAVNDPPVAQGSSASLDEDTAATGTLAASDPEGQALRYEMTAAPAHGTASLSGANWSYTPAHDYNGGDAFGWRACDTDGACSQPASVALTIRAVNDAPVASDAAFSGDEDTAIAGAVTASDVDSTALTYTAVAPPAHGTLALDAGGHFTYTPAADYNGADSFTFKANDGQADSNVATVTLTIAAVNDKPVATSAAASTDEDTALTGMLQATDKEDASLRYEMTRAPAHGAASVGTDGAYTYTPAADYNGADLLAFRACDSGNLCSDDGTLSITVKPVNDAPVAQAGSFSGDEDTVIAGAVTASDVDSTALTYAAVAPPAHGTLALDADGHFRYTPAADYNGSDSFTFKANDGQADSNVATVTLTLAPVNDRPTVASASKTTDEDTTASGRLTASDVDSTDLTFQAVDLPQHGTLTLDANGAYTYAPEKDFNGSDAFTYRACDSEPLCSDTATLSLTIRPVNDPPVIAPLDNVRVDEGQSTGPITLSLSDVDSDVNALTVQASSDNATLLPQDGMAVSGSGASRSLTLTPAAHQNGTAHVTVEVSDGTDTGHASFTLTVGAVNDAPTISAIESRSIDEDSSTGAIAFTVGDPDNASDTLDVSAVSSDTDLVPVSGLALGGSGNDRTITVTPAVNRSGTATITVTVSDGTSQAQSSFVLTVNSVDDAPQAYDDGFSTDEDTFAANLDVLHNDVDADSAIDPASVAIVAESHGVATANADGTVNFMPDANFFGDASFSYTVADVEGTRSQPAVVAMTVNPVDDAPVAQDQAFTVDEDPKDAYTGTLAASDVDNQAQDLTFRLNAPALHGSATVNADGSFSYRPDTNFNGADDFRFVASDGQKDSAPATVSVTVNAIGEAIVSVADASLNERDAKTHTLDFPVTLSRAPDGGSASVHYDIVDVTTTAGQDYTGPTSGTVTFTGGETSRVISVTVIDDTADEPDHETMRVVLSAPSASAELGRAVAIGTIDDDDSSNLLHIGAAKRSIVPTQAQIDGIEEERAFGGGTHKQYFNLGGFGINLGQNLADPLGDIPAQATNTEPATRRVFRDKAGQDENTNIRLFAVEQPGGTTVVFVMMDAIGAGNLIQAGVKNAIIAAAAAQKPPVQINPDNILFGLTHSHTAADLQGLWGGVPQDWIVNVLYKAAGDAATEAFTTIRPAHLKYRQGYTTEFNQYRRPRIDPNADADGTITLLTATGDDGTPVGSVLQYNAHPTTVGDGNKPRTPHSEYILGAMEWIEGHEGGTSLYFNGPIADARPDGSRQGCQNREANSGDPSGQVFGEVRCRGEGIADYLLHPGNVISGHELAPTLTSRSVQVTLPITNPAFVAAAGAGVFNRYYNFAQLPTDKIPGLTPAQIADLPQVAPVAITTVSRITLGGADEGLEVVSIPGETTNTYANYIRGLAKTKVMLLGLTHNSFGYILPEEEFSYVAQDGDNGFVLPFTGYEENVSLGPLTATLLRIEGYNQLFDASPDKNVPPAVSSCTDSSAPTTCALVMAEERINLAIDSVEACIENGLGGAGCPFGNAGFPNVIPGTGPLGVPGTDARLLQASADAQLRGCDMLDPSECLFPFPSDWFTVKAGDGSPQSAATGGTGRRINLNPLAMPRNAEGKPIDPTEWNRNDGYSPGQLIVTYVPGIGTVKGPDGKPTGPITGAVPLSDLARYADDDAPILVLDADTGERHPIYAEIDLNAGYLLPMQGFGPRTDKQPALLIRPAKNFLEGHRYVVVLRNLRNDYGQPIPAGPAFTDCRDHVDLGAMPVVQARCDELSDKVFPVLARSGIARDRSLYLAWDFTVASAKNDTARIVAMRDDAFASLGDTHGSAPGDAGYPAGRAPTYAVTSVEENPDDKTVRRIHGTLTVPSYVTPADPAPLANNAAFKSFADTIRQNQPAAFNTLRGLCNDSGADPLGVVCDAFDTGGSAQTAAGLSLPPNRLNFVPDGKNPCAGLSPGEIATSQCAAQARWGNGMPVRSPAGDITTTFTCNIPRSAVSGKGSMAQATRDDVKPVRPTLYGHGLLGGQGEANGQASDWGNRYGFMVCAADWFGFASGDIGTVAAALVDLSSFAAVPDGSQQGYLNQMFLARLAVHPDGFAANPNFQVQGKPVFDRREVFYDGNSQGGIMGGALVAMSKDINRGVLGVLGMNYSTLLARSTDFATYSIPLYLSYQGDLERPEVLSLMQMLWDRSENNGYAEHLTDNSAMGGPDNRVLMTPAYGDHQVTMYSADVMARTVGAGVDRRRVTDERKAAAGLPLTPEAELGLPTLDYNDPSQVTGSALVYYDEIWQRFDGDRCNTNTRTAPPPLGNLPPNADNLGAGAPLEDPSIVHNRGSDPHECPRRDPQARCQMSHFLQRTQGVAAGDTAGTLIDPSQQSRIYDDYDHGCPAVVRTGAPETGGTFAPPSTMQQLAAALQSFIDAVTSGDPAGAGTALQDAATLAVAYVTETVTGASDSVLALLTGTDASAPDGVWLKGDLHVHDDHSADGSGMRQTVGQGSPGNVSVADQIGFAETQGLDFLPLTDHRTFDQHYDPLWTSSKLLLVTGEEANGSPHATVFGASDMINQGDNAGSEPEFRRLQQSIWDAHAQGAAWSTAHPDDGEVETGSDGRPRLDSLGGITPNPMAYATGNDLAEVWNRGTLNRPKIAYAENRWNAGWRFGVAGASDDHFKELWPIAGPGTPMTRVLAASRSTPALLDALHAGHTVVNMGERSPFVTLTGDFDGDGKFETVGGDERVLASGKSVTLRVSVSNGAGATVYVYRAPGLYAGAAPFKVFTPTLPQQDFDFTVTASQEQDWYRVEARGSGEPDAVDYGRVLDCGSLLALPPDTGPCQPQYTPDPHPEDGLRAITAPIFISTTELAKPESPQLPADAGVPDGAQLLFGDATDNAFAGFADIAVAGGTVHAVAEVRSGHKSHVLYRARLADGTLTPPFDLSPASGLARAPSIAASGNDVWVAWQDERGNEQPHNPQIFLRHSGDAGMNWDAELQVSASAARAQRPDVALLNAATPVVVWEDNGGGAFDVLARIIGVDGGPVNLSASGKTVMAANAYDTRSARYPASVSPKVAVRADGAIAVAWQDNRQDVDAGWTGHDNTQASITSHKQPGQASNATQTDDWEIFAAVRSATGWSAPANVSNSSTQADRHAAIAFDASGALHAAWDSKRNDAMAGPRLEIREKVSSDLGASWSAVTQVTSAATSSSQRPVYGRNGDDLSLLWTDGRSADWRWRIMRGDSMVTGLGNTGWASYDNGFLAFTSDRAATREQRKPQQVYLLALDAPKAETQANATAPAPAAGGDGSLASKIIFGVVQPLTDDVAVHDDKPLVATATVYAQRTDGSYGPAANHVMTLVFEVDCGGQADPSGQVPCNNDGKHIARSQPLATDSDGNVTLTLSWDADAYGSGLKSLFGQVPAVGVHAMLVDNGADLASLADNHVMSYSPAAQGLFIAGQYAAAGTTEKSQFVPLMLLREGSAPAGLPQGQGVAGCLLQRDPLMCTAAVQNLYDSLRGSCGVDANQAAAALQRSFDQRDPGPFQDYAGSSANCAFNALYDAVGVGAAADTLQLLVQQCYASPASPACAQVRSTVDGTVPDKVDVLSQPLVRGQLTYTELPKAAPSAKVVDGNIDDWMGAATRIGGTSIYEYGEHIYSDFLFDAFGADNGEDARRLAALGVLGIASNRTERLDALQQAAGDQLGVPQPVGSRADHYGDATDREDGTDLTEVRWAADDTQLYFLARVAKLMSADNFVAIVLADTGAGGGMKGLDAGLTSKVFDRVIVLRRSGSRVIDLHTGASSLLEAQGGSVAVNADGYVNALEAGIPRALLETADGKLNVAVLTARASGTKFVPANLAYRDKEPVSIYNEHAQAMALFGGNVDAFTQLIKVADLTGGRTQSARPGPGYHERQFLSGDNISVEADAENGRLQPYGVYVPKKFGDAPLASRMTVWTHYRGGKAHSGAAWTPRLFHELGDDHDNIVVSPRGRGTSTWYTTRAHQDFFEVLADVAGTKLLNQYAAENLPTDNEFTREGLFTVDPAHVAISGYSMGGFATYLFAGLYPDLFSGGFAQSGAVTQGAWTGYGPEDAQCTAPAQDIPVEGDSGNPCFIEANDGRADAQLNWRILDNLRYVPIEINHGSNDELALTPGAERMGERLLELGYRYDMMTFIGYEHYSQAITDEWSDGAHYLNFQVARPENPRAVTYKVVPALVKAVNEVQLNGLNGNRPFTFHPDGAYWVDGLVVREGADGSIPASGVVPFGQIEAESGRLEGRSHQAVPRSGTDVDTSDPAQTWVSTPVYSPGNHTTPYIRHGLDWQDTGAVAGDANSFTATLTNLSAASLDTARMKLDFTRDVEATITIAQYGDPGQPPVTLALAQAPAGLCVENRGGPAAFAYADNQLRFGQAGTYVLSIHPRCDLFQAQLNRSVETRDESGATVVESVDALVSATHIGSTLALNAVDAAGVAIAPENFDARFEYRFLGPACSQRNPRVQIFWKMPDGSDQPSPGNLRGVVIDSTDAGWAEFRYSANTDEPGKSAPAGATAVSKIRMIMEAKVRDSANQAAGDCRMQIRNARVLDRGGVVYARYAPGAFAAADRPGYGQVCDGLGVAEASPVCAQLRSAESQLHKACEDNHGPDGFCTLTGGNLHALVEACTANNPGEAMLPACRIVDALAGGASMYCSQLAPTQDDAVCALFGGVLVSEAAMQRYESSWVHRALKLQDRLGAGLPLVHNTLLHTHNSFNATANNLPATASGSDYNQYYSIPDQLRMDIRGIEMDVHWMPGRDGSAATRGFEPMLCHGLSGSQLNGGCTSERPLREGLAEFRDWMDAHPDDVVMLYIEDDLSGYTNDGTKASGAPEAHDVTAQVVESLIGDIVYRPGDHNSSCNSNGDASDANSWLNVTRAQMLASGKRVLLITENCVGTAWNSLFHQKNNGNWQQGTQDSYDHIAYPQCEPSDANLIKGYRGREFTRVWEDSTVVTAVGADALSQGKYAPGSRNGFVTPPVMRELVRCGMNLPGVDRLYPSDGRLEAAVWSWAPGEPVANSTRECAALNRAGRFFAANCDEVRPHACVADDDPNAWTLGPAGTWSEVACPGGSHFSVPANGYANEKLKQAAGGAQVWLNYAEGANEGQWLGDAVAEPATVAPPSAGGDSQCLALELPQAVCGVFDTLIDSVSQRLGDVLGPAPVPADGLPVSLNAGTGLSRFVEPRIGSYPPGFTNPGPVAPYGMVELGPDTEGPINYGGYYFHNQLVSGFSHVHMSAGVYKGGYIPVLPFTGPLTAGDTTDVRPTLGGTPAKPLADQLPEDHPLPAYSSGFDHASEVADAGYYSILLTRYAVRAELTATERAGLHRYTFLDPAQPGRLLIDVSRSLQGYQDGAVSVSKGVIRGSVAADGGFRVYFAARASRPFIASPLAGSYGGTHAGVILDFPGTPSQVMLKVGISYTDEAGALANLDAEIPGWDFDAVRKATIAKWDAALAAIEVEGGTSDQLISFYSALYRAQQWPNLHSDVNGRYRGPDGLAHAADGHDHYSQFSSWDSYRGQNQLQAEIAPARYNEMLHSLVAFNREAGFLPRWQEGPRDASHMSGDPILPFIGEAWCRGQADASLRSELWPAMKSLAARRDSRLLDNGYLPTDAPKPYGASGEAPFDDAQRTLVEAQAGHNSAGTTLEYCIADFSLALMAQQAAPGEAAAIRDRSLNYRNLIDADGWIHPRLADGSWLTPFQPEFGYGFQEGTSWQYSWLAMHDYAGVIGHMHGDKAVNDRLDTFFGFPFGDAPIAWPTAQSAATAFGTVYVGNQYVPGNEHDLEAPYVYAYTGAPWKTQAVARAAGSIYTPTINGLPGNDDLGALSGWLVWNMAGVYPVNPGTPLAVIGSPVFTKVTMHRPGGDFVIEAPGASQANEFVQSVRVDNIASDRAWLILPRGASRITLTMGPSPAMAFGEAASVRPPSLSTHSLAAFGCSVAPLSDDSDGDGIVDGRDQCPGTAGAAANNGCP